LFIHPLAANEDRHCLADYLLRRNDPLAKQTHASDGGIGAAT
jgi:hypothetical protein